MTDTDTWFTEFGDRLASARNPVIYWLALMTLLIGVVGLLWALPIPEAFSNISPLLNFGSVFLMAALVYYFVLSLTVGIGMAPFVLGIAGIELWIAEQPVGHAYIACVLIGASVSGLSFGHYGRGGLRAVLRDIQLVMIAPPWVLAGIYRKLGIPV